jgi:hypothetical protein
MLFATRQLLTKAQACSIIQNMSFKRPNPILVSPTTLRHGPGIEEQARVRDNIYRARVRGGRIGGAAVAGGVILVTLAAAELGDQGHGSSTVENEVVVPVVDSVPDQIRVTGTTLAIPDEPGEGIQSLVEEEARDSGVVIDWEETQRLVKAARNLNKYPSPQYDVPYAIPDLTSTTTTTPTQDTTTLPTQVPQKP